MFTLVVLYTYINMRRDMDDSLINIEKLILYEKIFCEKAPEDYSKKITTLLENISLSDAILW